jgi:hypothetical protein
MSERKTIRRDAAIAIGMICIVLVAGLIATIAVCTSTISILNSQVMNLQNQLNALQTQVNDLRNVTAFVTMDEIRLNPSLWVNRTVAVEGKLSGPYTGFIPEEGPPPFDYKLNRVNETYDTLPKPPYELNGFPVSIWVDWNGTGDYWWTKVTVFGVVKESGFLYYIRAQEIYLL